MEETNCVQFENTALSNKSSKYQIDLEKLLTFIFPSELQHPLAASRLVVYALYGPLDEDNNLRTGIKRRHVVSVWEMDEMCADVEREDIISIYTQKQGDMSMLTIQDQEQIISQADSKFKLAKGRAMLPALSKEEIRGMLHFLPRENGLLCFHDIQEAVNKYRSNRIKNNKLVFPKLGEGIPKVSSNTKSLKSSHSLIVSSKTKTKNVFVPESIAPNTMFLKDKGQTNADIIYTTNRYLSHHAYKLTDIDKKESGSSIVQNVRMLREVAPVIPNHYEGTRSEWNSTAVLKGTQLGSLVNAAASSSTWKRKTS